MPGTRIGLDGESFRPGRRRSWLEHPCRSLLPVQTGRYRFRTRRFCSWPAALLRASPDCHIARRAAGIIFPGSVDEYSRPVASVTGRRPCRLGRERSEPSPLRIMPTTPPPIWRPRRRPEFPRSFFITFSAVRASSPPDVPGGGAGLLRTPPASTLTSSIPVVTVPELERDRPKDSAEGAAPVGADVACVGNRQAATACSGQRRSPRCVRRSHRGLASPTRSRRRSPPWSASASQSSEPTHTYGASPASGLSVRAGRMPRPN